MSKFLGIDVGQRKIGLAVGDDETKLAFARPALVVDSWDAAWPMLRELIETERITTVVVGWPLNTDGSTGPQAQVVEQFIQALQTRTTATIVRFDERLTTQAVQREQQGRRLERGQEDSLAAQLMLESYVQAQS